MDVDVDVRSILNAIHVPTVVMHRSEDAPDARIAHDAPTARYIVENVPQATAVDIGPTGRLDRIPSVLEDFLPGAWQEREQSLAHRRVLATVLFTDLVDSTEKAVQYGPRWHELLREHNAAIRRELARFSGREIDTAGDGFFASGFDGPARAIRCACAIRDATSLTASSPALLSTSAPASPHKRAKAKCSSLAPSKIRWLVPVSPFEGRGVRELNGLGEWPLYAVADSDERANA
jgi:hypothetical protein